MIRNGITEHHVVFFGGRIGVSASVGHSTRGTEKPVPTVYVGFQELVDPQEIGSNVAKGTAEFPPRLFMGFRKAESIDVVIRALEKAKAKLNEIEAANKALDGMVEGKEEKKDDSEPGVPT